MFNPINPIIPANVIADNIIKRMHNLETSSSYDLRAEEPVYSVYSSYDVCSPHTWWPRHLNQEELVNTTFTMLDGTSNVEVLTGWEAYDATMTKVSSCREVILDYFDGESAELRLNGTFHINEDVTCYARAGFVNAIDKPASWSSYVKCYYLLGNQIDSREELDPVVSLVKKAEPDLFNKYMLYV